MIERGNIVRIPRGTPYVGSSGVRRQARTYVAVVESATVASGRLRWEDELLDAAETAGLRLVHYVVGEDYRSVAETTVELLDDGDHALKVGRSQVVGGSPIRGGGNFYTTRGSCSCGRRCWSNGSTKRDVERNWREHVLALADPEERERELGYVARDVELAQRGRRPRTT
jgi:hypothetical protein